MQSQKGLTVITFLVIILIASGLIAGGSLYIKNKVLIKQNNPPERTLQSKPTTSDPTTNWKILLSNVCHVSLKYPPDWKGELTEKDQFCSFKITSPSSPNWLFDFSNIILYKITVQEFWQQKNTDAVDITIDDTKGFRQLLTGDHVSANTDQIAVLKGEMPFFGHIIYSPSDKTTIVIFDKILASIKFTAKSDQYKAVQNLSKEDFQKNIENQTRDQVLKANAVSLQQMVEKYKQQNGSYPQTIDTLKNTEDYKGWLQNVTGTKTSVQDYIYQANSGNYTISITLSDKSIYRLPR